MMGFTLSRVSLFVCGAILMAAVAVPIAGMYLDRGDDGLSRVAEADAQFVDAVWNADLDETVLRGDILLPSPSCSLVLDGYFLTITDSNGNSHVSSMKHMSDRIEIGYGDSVSVSRYGDRLMLTESVPAEPEVSEIHAGYGAEAWTSGDSKPVIDEPHGNSYTVTNDSGNSITISCGPA